MSIRLVSTSHRILDSEGNTTQLRLSFDMNAKDRKSITRNRKEFRQFVLELIGDALLDSPGRCECSHCLNDWDCCGRLVPGLIGREVRKGGLIVTQQFDRNI